MTRDIFSELAQQLGKSREEVVQFFQVLWQLVPPSPETQPYFFRYLDERFGRIEDRYEFLRQEMEQGFAQAAERDEALRREFQQQIEGLRGELRRFERLFLAFTVPVILLLAGILLQNFIK